jgi:hypothetical protein
MECIPMCDQTQQAICEGTNMVRDPDLVRDLLLLVEKDDKYDGTQEIPYDTPEQLGISGHTMEEVKYHLTLLIDDVGFLKGANTAGALPGFTRLTSAGHDFVGNIANPEIWSRVKSRIEKTPRASLSVVAEIAEEEIRKKVGLITV